jgi:hypothetical protein
MAVTGLGPGSNAQSVKVTLDVDLDGNLNMNANVGVNGSCSCHEHRNDRSRSSISQQRPLLVFTAARSFRLPRRSTSKVVFMFTFKSMSTLTEALGLDPMPLT